MKKKLICLLLLGFFLMPFNVLAYTVTEAKEIYEKISTTTDEEGNSTLILNSLSPSDLVSDGACSFTKEKIEAECEDCYTDYTAEDWENIIEERTASCTNNLITAAVEMHMIDAGISMSDEIQIWLEEGLVVVGIETGVDEYQNPVYVHNDYRVTFNLSDHKDRNAARDVAAEFADGYTIGGLTVFNTLYHFGTIEDNMYSSKETLYLFEEAKNIMSSHPEFEYRVVLRGGGGSEVGTGATLMVGVYKDDALLAIEGINVGMYNVLTVDKEGSATPYDKAVKLLSDYFNNKVAIEVDEETKETFDNVEYINNDLNDYFGREDGSYVGYFAVFKIAGKEHTVMIIESDELLEEDLVVSAVDSTNSIKIETNSYDVPVDVIIESRDVSKSDVVVNAGKKFNKKFSKAFDIKLLSKNSNKLLSDIAGGVNVYIQVGNEYREDDPINVFYINDNGELEETIEGKIIKDDGKLYATFMVYHFSVYALEEPLGDYIASSGEATPDTGDTIMVSVCAAIISLTGVIYIKKKYLI